MEQALRACHRKVGVKDGAGDIVPFIPFWPRSLRTIVEKIEPLSVQMLL